MKVLIFPAALILFASSAAPQVNGPDFDGDGLPDIAGVEIQNDGSPNENNIIWRSSASLSINSFEFGKSSETLVVADYDGDGITDPAVVGLEGRFYRWRYKLSGSGNLEGSDLFGVEREKVLFGCDFDEDAKADRATIDGNGLITLQKSADQSVTSFTLTVEGIERFACADLDGDGFDEIIGQKNVKLVKEPKLRQKSNKNRKQKNKKKKGKNREKQPARSAEKSYFYVWSIDGTLRREVEFGKKVKEIHIADIDGDGINDLGYERERSRSVKQLVFLQGQSEAVFNLPYFNKLSMQGGFFFKTKNDDEFIKVSSLYDLTAAERLTLPRGESTLDIRGFVTVGPVLSEETVCSQHMEPNDGNEGFLWKPVSDTTGLAVVIVPPSFRLKNVKILKDGVTVESLRYAGNANGGRDHYRSARRASSFEDNITVAGTQGGITYCWLIEDPTKRYD